jgi:hypothetical protein
MLDSVKKIILPLKLRRLGRAGGWSFFGGGTASPVRATGRRAVAFFGPVLVSIAGAAPGRTVVFTGASRRTVVVIVASVVTVVIVVASVVTVIVVVASALTVVIVPEASFVFVNTSVNSGLCFVVVGSRRRAARTSRWRLRSYLSPRTRTRLEKMFMSPRTRTRWDKIIM